MIGRFLPFAFSMALLLSLSACANKNGMDQADRWQNCQKSPTTKCILEETTALANTVSTGKRSLALFPVAAALARTGQFEDALELAHSIPHSKYRSAALDAISELLAKSNRFQDASAIATQIDREISRVQALAAISVAMHEAGRDRDALNEMTKALKVLSGISDYDDLEFALFSIVSAAIQLDRLPELLEIAIDRGDIASLNQLYVFVAPKLGHAGRFEEAVAMAQKFKITRDADRNAFFFSLLSIGKDQLKAGKDSAAKATLSEAQAFAETIKDQYARSSNLSYLVTAYANAGLLDDARRVTELIRDNDTRRSATRTLEMARIDNLLDTGRLQEAVALADEVNASAQGYNKIAIAFHNAGKVRQTSKMLEFTLTKATLIVRDDWRAIVLGEMAREQAKSGSTPNAKRMFALAHESAMNVAGNPQRIDTLVRLAGYQFESRLPAGANRALVDSLIAAKQIENGSTMSGMLHSVALSIYMGECVINSQDSVELARRCIKM